MKTKDNLLLYLMSFLMVPAGLAGLPWAQFLKFGKWYIKIIIIIWIIMLIVILVMWWTMMSKMP